MRKEPLPGEVSGAGAAGGCGNEPSAALPCLGVPSGPHGPPAPPIPLLLGGIREEHVKGAVGMRIIYSVGFAVP